MDAVEEIQLCALNDMDIDDEWEKLEITVDSGAGNSVANGDNFPGIPREESEGSRRGQSYVGAGGEKIPNRGQKRFMVKPHNE